MTLITHENAKGLLSLDAILAAQDLPTKDVEVSEWGGKVRIRAMTSVDRDDFEMTVAKAREEGRPMPENVRAIIAARCIVGEDGDQLFTLDNVQALGLKSAKALGKVYDAILEMNALEPGAIEDAAKNSSSDQDDGSSTGSPSDSVAQSEASKPNSRRKS